MEGFDNALVKSIIQHTCTMNQVFYQELWYVLICVFENKSSFVSLFFTCSKRSFNFYLY